MAPKLPLYPPIVDTYIAVARGTVLQGNISAQWALASYNTQTGANKERALAALNATRAFRDRARAALAGARAIPAAIGPVTKLGAPRDYTGRATVLAAIALSQQTVTLGNTAATRCKTVTNYVTGQAFATAKSALDAVRSARDTGKEALTDGRLTDATLLNPT